MADERKETKAARIVAALASVRCHRLDDGKKGSVADFELFDIEYNPIGLLEVTSDVDEDSAEFEAIARSHEYKVATGEAGREPSLHAIWRIYVGHPPPQFKDLTRALLPLLRRLEELCETWSIGLEVGASSQYPPPVAEVCDRLRELRVTYVCSMPATGGGPGAVLCYEAQPAGFASVWKVTEAANRQLARQDNQRKLAASCGGPNRWLFVWVDEPAGQALRHGPSGPQGPGPEFKGDITGVWVAPMFGPPPAGDVWFAGRAPWVERWSGSWVRG